MERLTDGQMFLQVFTHNDLIVVNINPHATEWGPFGPWAYIFVHHFPNLNRKKISYHKFVNLYIYMSCLYS